MIVERGRLEFVGLEGLVAQNFWMGDTVDLYIDGEDGKKERRPTVRVVYHGDQIVIQVFSSGYRAPDDEA